MGNRIGKEMLSNLQEIMRSKPNLVSLCGITDDATEADLSGLNMDADDAIILASELPDKRALTLLNVSNNSIVSESSNIDRRNELKDGELVEHDGVMCPVSAQWGAGYRVYLMHGIIALADAIKDMRAISQFTFSGDYGDSTPVTVETSMVEVDFSGKHLGAPGATMLSAFLPKCT
jgi:hypothetical protein